VTVGGRGVGLGGIAVEVGLGVEATQAERQSEAKRAAHSHRGDRIAADYTFRGPSGLAHGWEENRPAGVQVPPSGRSDPRRAPLPQSWREAKTKTIGRRLVSA
jgi:hypothetical protein